MMLFFFQICSSWLVNVALVVITFTKPNQKCSSVAINSLLNTSVWNSGLSLIYTLSFISFVNKHNFIDREEDALQNLIIRVKSVCYLACTYFVTAFFACNKGSKKQIQEIWHPSYDKVHICDISLRIKFKKSSIS